MYQIAFVHQELDAITQSNVSVSVYKRSRQIVILSLIDKEIEIIEITS